MKTCSGQILPLKKIKNENIWYIKKIKEPFIFIYVKKYIIIINEDIFTLISWH